MQEPSQRRGSLWLISGVILLFISFCLYLYDQFRTDEWIYSQLEEVLQEDFETCIQYYSSETPPTTDAPQDICDACKLSYDKNGRLVDWDNSSFLPAQQQIERLKNLQDVPVLHFPKTSRAYYQIRKVYRDSTTIHLIPIYIPYRINNDFLKPKIFWGRYESQFSTRKHAEWLRNLAVTTQGTPDVDADISLSDLNSRTVLSIRDFPAMIMRFNIRLSVLLTLLAGIGCVLIYLRIFTLQVPHYRYFVNVGLFVGIILLRILIFYLGFPHEYLQAELFRPEILAFNAILAPDLGNLTINVFTFGALVLIAYLHFYRQSNIFFRRLIQDHLIAYPAMLLTTGLSSLVIYAYVYAFNTITSNSQVDIEFSNLFETNFYSYLILLDVGLLLLAAGLIIFSLLKLNLLYAHRYRLPWYFVVFQLASIGLCNVYLFRHAPWLAAVGSVVLLLLSIILYRNVFRTFLRQDLVNFLLMILTISILVTYNVIQGINLHHENRVSVIARQLGSQQANISFSFTKTRQSLRDNMEEIRFNYRTLPEISDFSDWLTESYIAPNFKEYDVSLSFYTNDGRRIDRNYAETTYGPGLITGSPSSGELVSNKFQLYEFPNIENKYLNVYVGADTLDLRVDTVRSLLVIMQFKPSTQRSEGLYPSLMLNQQMFENIKLLHTYDHAVYWDGKLYIKGGESPFPLVMRDFEEYTNKASRQRGDYHEYLEPIGKSKLVIVRYPQVNWYDIITTFSLIFYFYVIGAGVFLALPLLLIRALRKKNFNYSIPLRAKIRYGLLSISIMPMLVIIFLLYPLVSKRYYEDAQKDLVEKAERVKDVVRPDYITIRRDVLGRLSLRRDFQDKILDLADLIKSDINIYDEEGKPLASTRPTIAENGIATDLMNEEAKRTLNTDGFSDVVIREKIGSLTFLSAYEPIRASNQTIGYVNIPFLARQDELEAQVRDFLAYLANIYLLVFLLLNVIAIVLSNAITQPLRLVQQRLAATSLERENIPIDYYSRDEIGEIVSAYNQMVNQLSVSEQKLAQSQRELAWRQMARQVAHEIKNPLTPMRLSIQHLTQVWKGQSDKLDKMFPKVMKTLMVQIDSLVRIANSFSEFARMPDPVKTQILVNEVLLEVVDLYAQSEEIIWLIDVPEAPFFTFADRDQLSRCFNNIIKNGLQAIEENGIMHVSMRVLKDRARIEIKDNGKGMPEEVQRRLFEPSFSTKTSGMGLGLAIVKKIIENIGGRISFRSELTVGTIFIIELPASQRSQVEAS